MGKTLITFLALVFLYPLSGTAQLNSPYSRYGIGNLMPQGSLTTRSLGGISAGFADPATINNVNPASYSNLTFTTLDLGLEYNGMKLHSNHPVESFNSKDAIFSYFSLGFPLLNGNEKAKKKKISWGMSLGLKPVSKINYSVSSIERTSIDSIKNAYDGDGGVDKAYIGMGFRVKGLSIGANTGYLFARKNYSSTVEIVNDTVAYQKANYNTRSRFGGAFLDLGVQYGFKIKKGYMRLGAYSDLKGNYTGHREDYVTTFNYDPDFNEKVTVDSILTNNLGKGKIILPATYGFGFTYENSHLLVGADYEQTQWKDYRFFGSSDFVTNSWKAKGGIQFFPATETSTSLLSFIKYRVGFSFGQDYIDVNRKLPVYNVSAGFGIPLRLTRSFFDRQFSTMNVTFEYGSRGNSKNDITEKTFRIGLGFSLSDVWFIRSKYQ